MAPYRSPQVGEKIFTKFVRVGGDLFVGETMYVGHSKIVEQDGLSEAIEALRVSDPKQLDAGLVDIRGNEINPHDNSDTLGLPIQEVRVEARQISRETFASQSPNHTILGLERR